LQTTGTYMKGLCFAMLKCGFTFVSNKMASLIDDRAIILGTSLVELGASVMICQMAAQTVTPYVLLFVMSFDLLAAFVVVLTIGQTSICGVAIGHYILFPANYVKKCARRALSCMKTSTDNDATGNDVPFDEHELSAKIYEKRIFLACSELSEALAPIAYGASWLVTYFGRNADTFSGVGTSEYGVEAPEDVGQYLVKLLVVTVFQGSSLFVVQLFMKCVNGPNDDAGFQWRQLFEEYGVVWSLQTIWIINSEFCFRMLSCGFDFSLSWKAAPTGG